ncbi:WD40 repeat-like protein, partial [Caulochytrium protostelioides]
MVSATPTKAAAAAGASGTSSTPSPARSGSTPKSVRKASKGASPSPASAKKDTLASTPVKTGAARSTSSSSSSSSNKAARTKSPQHTTPSKPAASAATSDALPALAAPAPAVADARREPPLSHPSPVKRDARPTSPSHPLSSTPNSVLSDLPTPTATPSRELGATMATPTAAAAAAAAALSSVAAADGVAASTPASTPEAAATKPEIELGLATTMAIDAAAVPVDESVPDSDETMLVDDAEPVAAAPTAARAVVSDPFQDWSVDELPTAMGFHFGPAPAAAEAEDTATPWALDAADLQDAAPRAVVPQLHPFLTSRVAPVAPLFNHTDELVCFAVGATVKVVSAPTQQVVRTLAPELGAADRVSPIVAMHIDARRRYELWTCAQNGVFRMWDYEEGAVRREWDIARPVRWVVPDHLDGQFVFVVLESEAPAAAIADQLQRDVVTGDAEARSLGALSPVYRMDLQSGQLTYLTHVAAEVAFAVSAGGDFLVAGHPTGCEVLLLGQGSTATATNSSASDAAPDTASAVVTVQARRMFWTPKRLTALTTHDTLACLAAGFEDGHIDLMSCFEGRFFTSDAKSAVPSTRLHWHAQAVTSLQFSPGGPYLHSGGHEATLVVWNIETHAKRFMPRLGTSALFGMGASPQHTMIALIHADSAVHLVKTADFSHVPLTLGFQQGHDTHDRMHPVPATVQHGSLRAHRGVWATEGVPGTLQFMDVFDKTPLDPVVVAPATQVTAAHQTDAAVPQPHIDHVAWSPDGAWMATVDHIRFGATAADRTQATERTHLKFWSRETAASPASASASASSSSPWTQNTKILQPHGAVVSGRHARITGLHFLDAERAVTSAADGTVKFWQCETLVHPSTNDDASKTDIFWRCAQTTGYQKRAATAMALSGDRTLLAIAFGDAVTLWDARGHRLLHVLRMPNASAARAEDTVWSVSQMGFLPHTPFLVASSARGIALWDLQRLAVVWHHALA